MSETAVDYNRFRITRNHDDIGHGQIVAKHPETVNIGGLVTFDLTADVYLGDYVEIAPGAHIFTHKHLWNHSRGLRKDIQDVVKYPLVVGRDVFIGVNAIILGGVQKIGDGAVIGAGAVLTRPVPEWEIWAGNPARKIGMRFENKSGVE
jgi:acetyltransferase-like isoleucine patch superfamily enzyme